jgi:oxygen-independent coproporphyrinogen-3 oxidase
VEVGVYIHIPFCVSKCHYCDFYSVGLGSPGGEEGGWVEAYLSALEQEIDYWSGRVRGRTLYVGGGTPTFLPTDPLTSVIRRAREAFAVPEGAEITVEANPGTADESRFAALREVGVNRLSLGVQSFDDELLAFLGRVHRAADAVRAFRQARAAGWANVSLDLMFGLPRQSLQKWEDSLQQVVNLEPEHVSLYGLGVEEGTPLAEWVAAGREVLPPEEVEAEMYGRAIDLLEAHGYERYEISNFARPGYACLHNDIYWRNEPYLGLGAGACSYLGGERTGNVRDVGQYIANLRQGRRPVAERERLPRRGQMGETMMLGLRRAAGVDGARFRERFGDPPEAAFAEELEKLVQAGLLTTDGTHWKLTRRGLFLANQAFLEFV